MTYLVRIWLIGLWILFLVFGAEAGEEVDSATEGAFAVGGVTVVICVGLVVQNWQFGGTRSVTRDGRRRLRCEHPVIALAFGFRGQAGWESWCRGAGGG